MTAEQAIVEIEKILAVPSMNFFHRFDAITKIIDRVEFTDSAYNAELISLRKDR